MRVVVSATGPILHLLEADARTRYPVLIEVGGAEQREAPRRHFKEMDHNTVFGGFRVDRDGVQIAHKRVLFQWQDGTRNETTRSTSSAPVERRGRERAFYEQGTSTRG